MAGLGPIPLSQNLQASLLNHSERIPAALAREPASPALQEPATGTLRMTSAATAAYSLDDNSVSGQEGVGSSNLGGSHAWSSHNSRAKSASTASSSLPTVSELGTEVAGTDVVVPGSQSAAARTVCSPTEVLTTWRAVAKTQAKQRAMEEAVVEIREQRQRHQAAVKKLEELGAAHAVEEGFLLPYSPSAVNSMLTSLRGFYCVVFRT